MKKESQLTSNVILKCYNSNMYIYIYLRKIDFRLISEYLQKQKSATNYLELKYSQETFKKVFLHYNILLII